MNDSITDVADADAPPQPLFYRTPEPLNAERHARLGLRPAADYSFARHATSVLLVVSEFALASRNYPIVFTTHETPMPVAIVGTHNGKNLFVKDGQWQAHTYIPAYVRRFPFAFVENEDRSRLILCIDTSADAVSEDSERKFFDGSEPTELTKNALEFCTAFQRQHAITRAMGDLLKKHDLLTPRRAELTLADRSKLGLHDFQAVDEERLNALSDEDFLEFRKNGTLPYLYFHLMSMANFRDLAELSST